MATGRSCWKSPSRTNASPRPGFPCSVPCFSRAANGSPLSPARQRQGTTESGRLAPRLAVNCCFGHGVFRKDLASYAEDALHWLGRLHDAVDLCRPLLESLALESVGPKGEILTWGEKSPLPFYHGHLPAAAGPLLPPVRVRTPAGDALPLTPLLSVQLCAVCGQWTGFYLDKYDKDKHRAQFLELHRGAQ